MNHRCVAMLDPEVRALLPRLVPATLTLLLGFALGAAFGLNEELILTRLAAAAKAVVAKS